MISLENSMEYLDIVDFDGNPTGEIVERTIAHQKGVRHTTSHVWLYRRKETIEILIQKRSANKDSFPGCYDISTAGHVPAGVDNITSAIREAREELGIVLKKDQFTQIGVTHVDYNLEFHGEMFHDVQTSKVYLVELNQDEFEVQKEEIESTMWIDLEECKKAVKNQLIPNCIRLSELEMIEKQLKEA